MVTHVEEEKDGGLFRAVNAVRWVLGDSRAASTSCKHASSIGESAGKTELDKDQGKHADETPKKRGRRDMPRFIRSGMGNDDKKQRLIIVRVSRRIAKSHTQTQQCHWTHHHTLLRTCAWTEGDGTNCDDATDKCRHRPRPTVPATSRWATQRSFAQSLGQQNRGAQEALAMPKQRLRSRLAWLALAVSSARDEEEVTSEFALACTAVPCHATGS